MWWILFKTTMSARTSGAANAQAGLISMPMIKPHPRTSEIMSGNFFWRSSASDRSCDAETTKKQTGEVMIQLLTNRTEKTCN